MANLVGALHAPIPAWKVLGFALTLLEGGLDDFPSAHDLLLDGVSAVSLDRQLNLLIEIGYFESVDPCFDGLSIFVCTLFGVEPLHSSRIILLSNVRTITNHLHQINEGLD